MVARVPFRVRNYEHGSSDSECELQAGLVRRHRMEQTGWSRSNEVIPIPASRDTQEARRPGRGSDSSAGVHNASSHTQATPVKKRSRSCDFRTSTFQDTRVTENGEVLMARQYTVNRGPHLNIFIRELEANHGAGPLSVRTQAARRGPIEGTKPTFGVAFEGCMPRTTLRYASSDEDASSERNYQQSADPTQQGYSQQRAPNLERSAEIQPKYLPAMDKQFEEPRRRRIKARFNNELWERAAPIKQHKRSNQDLKKLQQLQEEIDRIKADYQKLWEHAVPRKVEPEVPKWSKESFMMFITMMVTIFSSYILYCRS